MKRSTRIKVEQLIKHPRYKKFTRKQAIEAVLAKLQRERQQSFKAKGPCFCQKWDKCRKCKATKEGYDKRKATGLWEGPGKREWSLWPAPDWDAILSRTCTK